MVWGPDWEFNTPTLTISAMGSLMTSESQDTCLTSHPKDSTLHRAVSPIRPEGRVPPTGPRTPLPAASGLPSRNWPGSTLLSFRSNPAVVCRLVFCWHVAEQGGFEKKCVANQSWLMRTSGVLQWLTGPQSHEWPGSFIQTAHITGKLCSRPLSPDVLLEQRKGLEEGQIEGKSWCDVDVQRGVMPGSCLLMKDDNVGCLFSVFDLEVLYFSEERYFRGFWERDFMICIIGGNVQNGNHLQCKIWFHKIVILFDDFRNSYSYVSVEAHCIVTHCVLYYSVLVSL
jgi:hypothetical protein